MQQSSAYALGAAVFGDEQAAKAFAARLLVGVVVINDVIVPTADPRLPFGGRGRSGFGATRGAEGLLAMTVQKAISVRKGKWLPHLERPSKDDGMLFAGFVRFLHAGSWSSRIAGMKQMTAAVRKRKKEID